MTLRKRLMRAYGALFTAGVLAAVWLGYAAGERTGGGQDLPVVLLVLWMLGISLVYLVALWISRPLEALAEQAEKQREIRGPWQVQGLAELELLTGKLNHMELELSRGSHSRDQLVADVAHELRTPLAILRGQLESMLEGRAELVPEQLLPMLDETTRLTRLVQDLQQLSLAKAGALPLLRTWVPFAELLQEITGVLELEAELKGTELLVSGYVEEEVYCDRVRIKQVLINLIGNAIRYTPDGGRVEVQVRRGQGKLHVAVRDNGPGIPPENLPYLFERFYRVEGSRSRQSGGMGLGLAIAKEFAVAHGGSLGVQSEPGEGTTFTLTLPLFPTS
ncbi:two-component system sensor histidine kinase BaeS [Tumebacillus sp. BK434]|uniref:sensor histidine kinase n=1 Tax=Tumebacillus sp. BK434 TaxID=2512169 RepID=UPI0010481297|nr:HAMP domain-containing sensor histidine kinase [Tumebacillus sp. BK434]TCP58261.1 two-component system sensor histidine kinase BaeS [Tumebacillus sp. BK434]